MPYYGPSSIDGKYSGYSKISQLLQIDAVSRVLPPRAEATKKIAFRGARANHLEQIAAIPINMPFGVFGREQLNV